MYSRRLFLCAGMQAALAFLALGADPVAPVNQNRSSVAMEGYDPVAYFLAGKPLKGEVRWTHSWNGATWRFASQENRDRFASDPEQYAPQYGGYCSYAVSENYTAEIDPQAWTIVGGKLYLNYSKKVQGIWEKDRDQRIRRANQNWPSLHR